MEGRQEASEVLQLLEDYCTKRSRQNWSGASQWRIMMSKVQGASSLDPDSSSPPSKASKYLQYKRTTVSVPGIYNLDADSSRPPLIAQHEGPAPPRRGVTERLVKITESAPIRKEDVQTQEEIIQKLVELMVAFGDDINARLKQNQVLEQQLQNMNYSTFEKLISAVQSLVAPGSQEAGPDSRIEQQKIAWAFEVTSRLSAVGVVQHRRVLNFGAQYIEQNHASWVRQRGGWEEAFDID